MNVSKHTDQTENKVPVELHTAGLMLLRDSKRRTSNQASFDSSHPRHAYVMKMSIGHDVETAPHGILQDHEAVEEFPQARKEACRRKHRLSCAQVRQKSTVGQLQPTERHTSTTDREGQRPSRQRKGKVTQPKITNRRQGPGLRGSCQFSLDYAQLSKTRATA